MESQQLAPEFFFGAVQAEDDDGVEFQAFPLLPDGSASLPAFHLAGRHCALLARAPTARRDTIGATAGQQRVVHTAIGFKSSARRRRGSVCAWTASGVAPGASSRGTRPS